MLKVAATVGIEDSGKHHLGKANALPLLYLLNTAGVPLPSRLFRNTPVNFLGTSHAESGLEHVLLADGEGTNVHDLILQILKAGFSVRTFGPDGQTEKSGDGATDLAKNSVAFQKERKETDDYRRTCGKVEVEILVSPSSKKLTARLAKSMPKAAGRARPHSYQKPVDTAM